MEVLWNAHFVNFQTSSLKVGYQTFAWITLVLQTKKLFAKHLSLLCGSLQKQTGNTWFGDSHVYPHPHFGIFHEPVPHHFHFVVVT